MKVAQQLQYHIKVEQVKSYSTLYQTTSQVILFELNLLKSILQQLQHHYQMRTFNLLFLRGLIKLHLVQLRSFEDAEVQAKKKGIKKSKIGASSKASSSKKYTVMTLASQTLRIQKLLMMTQNLPWQ